MKIDEVMNDEFKKEMYKRSKTLYTLSFSYEFKYDNDVVFFAHFIPYTFSDL